MSRVCLRYMNKADDRYHTIYRIMFPISYRYVESRSCRLETPHYHYVPHDKSKRGARSCQEWETDQGHYQESGVAQTAVKRDCAYLVRCQ